LRRSSNPTLSPTREAGQSLPASPYLLYEKKVQSDICTLLVGEVTVVTGVDYFKSDTSSWTVLGARALKGERVTL